MSYSATLIIRTRSLKSDKEPLSGEIVSLDKLEEIASFQDKYEHVGQKHKLIKKVKIKMIQDKEMMQD
ncbi:hypothetical protein Tco_0414176 [Tanacetum coccineum]